jgi:hypothetical protein
MHGNGKFQLHQSVASKRKTPEETQHTNNMWFLHGGLSGQQIGMMEDFGCTVSQFQLASTAMVPKWPKKGKVDPVLN